MRILRPSAPWILLGATLMGLCLAWTLKEPCVGVAWDGNQYSDMCYSDLRWIYENRHQAHDPVPYTDMRTDHADARLVDRYGFLEYPVLTGLLIHTTARLSDDVGQFYAWNIAILSAFALGTTWLLYRMVDDPRRIALWALGPPMLLYAFHNWDLMAVFFTVLALHHLRRGDALHSGIALALGACAKLFPLFLAPILGIAWLRREGRIGPRTLGFGAGFAGIALLLNLPFFLLNRALFLETYRFHADRPANFETLWYVIGHYGREWKVDWMATVGTPTIYDPWIPAILLAGIVTLATLTWLRRLEAPAACLAFLALFLVANKVYSVQYTLWLLPFFALVKVPLKQFAALVAADLLVYVSVYTFFVHMWERPNNAWFDALAQATLARALVLLWILGSIAASAWTTTPTPRSMPSATPAGADVEPPG